MRSCSSPTLHLAVLAFFSIAFLFPCVFAQRPSQLDNPQFVEYFPNGGDELLWPLSREYSVGAHQTSSSRFWMWGGTRRYMVFGNDSGPFTGGQIIGNVTLVDRMDDLNVLDVTPTGATEDPLMTADWTVNVTQFGTVPTHRIHASTAVVPGGGGGPEHMYMVGGVAPANLPLVVSSFDQSAIPVYTLRLDPGNASWAEINATRDSSGSSWVSNDGYPSPRYGMSLDVLEYDAGGTGTRTYLVAFGGYSEFLPPLWTNFFYNEMWLLDTSTAQWCMVDNSSLTHSATGQPDARAFHSSTMYQGELWIFGGEYEFPRDVPNGTVAEPPLHTDVWKYTFPIFGDPCAPGGTWERVVPDASSATFVPRIYNAAVQYQDSFIVYAGHNLDVPINSMMVWDFTNRSWTAIPSGYPSTNPRSGFLSGVVDFTFFGKLLIATGGVFPNAQLNTIGLVSIDPIEAALAACVERGSSTQCQSISEWDGSSPICCVRSSVGSTQLNYNPVYPTYTIKESGDCESSTIRFSFTSVSEVDALNNSQQSVNMDLNNWDFLQGETDDTDTSSYNLVNDAGLQMNFSFALIREDTQVQFGPEAIPLERQDNKWAFSQQGWVFLDDQENLMMLEVAFVSEDEDWLGFDGGLVVADAAISVELMESTDQTAYRVETRKSAVRIVLANYAVSENATTASTIDVRHRVDLLGAREGRVRIFFPPVPADHRLDYDPEFSVLLTTDSTDCEDDLALLYLLLILTTCLPCCAIVCVCMCVSAFVVFHLGLAPLGYKAADALGVGPSKDIAELKMISFNVGDGPSATPSATYSSGGKTSSGARSEESSSASNRTYTSGTIGSSTQSAKTRRDESTTSE